MPGIVIFKGDLWPLVEKRCRPQMLAIKDIKVEVTFPDNPKLKAAFRKDPLLLQKLHDKIHAHMTQDVVSNLGNVVKKLDPKALAAAKIDDVEGLLKILDEFQRVAKSYARAASMRAGRKANQVWAEFCRTRSEYRRYQVVAGAKVAVGSAGLLASGGMTAGTIGVTTVSAIASGGATLASPTTWAAITLGILGTLKSAVGVGKDIYKLSLSADKLQKKIDKSLEKLGARYLDIVKGKKTGPGRSKGLIRATELGAESLRAVVGTSVTTISECDRMNTLFNDKLNGVVVKSHDLSKKLNVVLDDVQKLKKLKPQKKQKIERLEKKIHEILERTIAFHDKGETGKQAHLVYSRKLDVLKARKGDNASLTLLEKGISYAPDVALSALSLGLCKDPSDLLVTAISIAADLQIDLQDKLASQAIKRQYGRMLRRRV